MENDVRRKIEIFTDGACEPNPGTGGWSFILRSADNSFNEIVNSGYEENTTNNRMELKSVINSLEYFLQNIITENDDSEILIFSDSKYVVNGTNEWMEKWHQNNWVKSDKKPVLNDDLWKKLFNIKQKIHLKCIHVHGHTGHTENERCDQLAVKAINNHISTKQGTII